MVNGGSSIHESCVLIHGTDGRHARNIQDVNRLWLQGDRTLRPTSAYECSSLSCTEQFGQLLLDSPARPDYAYLDSSFP